MDDHASLAKNQKVDSAEPSRHISASSEYLLELPKVPSLLLPGSRHRGGWIVLAIFGVAALLMSVAIAWYTQQLSPVNHRSQAVQHIEIKDGQSFTDVVRMLKDDKLVTSMTAVDLYARLHHQRSDVKAGTCALTQAMSVADILNKLTVGCHDFVAVTFYPGATLETSRYAETAAQQEGTSFKDMSIRGSLRAAGYSEQDISEAFGATYSGPLFADKPSSAGYEGYAFGETYYVDANASAKDVLQMAFDHMYTIIQQNNIAAQFKAQGLTLYQGITLASIVERELDCEGKPTEARKQTCFGYQQRIARVFLNRLQKGMALGSDVTAIYASDKLNVASSVDVDSPYNTRKYTGLPPGPIATPGQLALLAVARPASSDDLYFLAGDDGLIYFASDEAGHEANIKNHCQRLCEAL